MLAQRASLTNRRSARQRVRQGTAIDVFEFASHRDAVRDAGHFKTEAQRKFAEIVCGRLPLHGGIGGENHFANLPQPEHVLELVQSQFGGPNSVERR